MNLPENKQPEEMNWADFCDSLGYERMGTQQLQERRRGIEIPARIPDAATIAAAYRERMKMSA